jgi:hypothetical protein
VATNPEKSYFTPQHYNKDVFVGTYGLIFAFMISEA